MKFCKFSATIKLCQPPRVHEYSSFLRLISHSSISLHPYLLQCILAESLFGLDDPVLNLSRDGGTSVRTVNVKQARRRIKDLAHLTTGTPCSGTFWLSALRLFHSSTLYLEHHSATDAPQPLKNDPESSTAHLIHQ